jgi:hypothetical protein
MSNNTTVAVTYPTIQQTLWSGDSNTIKVFQSDNVLAKNALGFQIDDVIGYTKNSMALNGTDPYTWYHWTQWSHTVTPAAGNVMTAWVSYHGWDSAVANGTSNVNLQVT